MDREKIIVRTGFIGIIANVFLAGFKAVIGFISGSIAITLDAVNNLTDVLSSVITIITTKLAGRTPDKKHPYGHGRIEYLSAMIIAVIILYAGITSLVESVKKIISPETPDYAPVSLIIIAVAVAVKIVLGLYVRATGEKVNSDSLVASGKDALLDAVISTSTLVAAGIFLIWHVSLEAWLAAVISLVIIKAGIDMLREGISSVLGERADSELSLKVLSTIRSYPEVSGAYDLIINNYGPDRYTGSVHIELPADYSVKELDLLQRKISEKVYLETGVGLTGISVYAKQEDSAFSNRVYGDLRDILAQHPEVLQLHGFSVDEKEKMIRFDVVVDFDEQDREGLIAHIIGDVKNALPGYDVVVAADSVEERVGQAIERKMNNISALTDRDLLR